MAHLSSEPRQSVEFTFCWLIPAAKKINRHEVEPSFVRGFLQAFNTFAA